MNHFSLAAIGYKNQGLLKPVNSKLFQALDIRMGAISTAENNKKAKIPSLRLVMDFGEGFNDLKQTSAQLKDNYLPQESSSELIAAEDGRSKAQLLGIQTAAVTNFPKRHVGISSHFLTLGIVSLLGESSGTVILVPAVACKNGAQVKLLNDSESSYEIRRLPIVEYGDTFDHLDIRVGTVISLENKLVDFGPDIGTFQYQGEYPLFKVGLQVLRVINFEDLSGLDNFLGIVDDQKQLIPLTLERPMPNGRFLK